MTTSVTRAQSDRCLCHCSFHCRGRLVCSFSRRSDNLCQDFVLLVNRKLNFYIVMEVQSHECKVKANVMTNSIRVKQADVMLDCLARPAVNGEM